MLKLQELQKLAKEIGFPRTSQMNKPELIAALIEKGAITEADVARKQKERKEVAPKREFMLSIRKNPKPVEITDIETGEVFSYPSLYKAARTYKTCTSRIALYNGKVWRKKYEVKVLEPI
jgi:hypothetical protein